MPVSTTVESVDTSFSLVEMNRIRSWAMIAPDKEDPITADPLWSERNAPHAARLDIDQLRNLDLAPAFNKVDAETSAFIAEHELSSGVDWLRAEAPNFLNGCNFEIDLLQAEEGEKTLMGLTVYGTYTAAEFRERMFQVYEAMLAAGHKELYDIIGIFQRRVTRDSWRLVSWGS